MCENKSTFLLKSVDTNSTTWYSKNVKGIHTNKKGRSDNLADVKALRKKIEDSGMSISFVARKMGMTRESFYNRMNKPDFRASEIVALTNILRLTKKERDTIFFN